MKATTLIRKIIDERPKIAVVGDYIEDRYILAEVTRISPEAPVMVARQVETKSSHGGAGNVWATLQNLGVDAYLFCNGDPANWTHEKDNVFVSPNINSVKTRVMSGTHHILRIDEEPDSKDIEWPIFQNLSWSEDFKAKILAREFECVVISDYEKGVISPQVAEMIIALCQDSCTPCIVDAKRNFERFLGADIIKCNNKEASTIENIWKTVYDLDVEHFVVTNGENGIDVYTPSNKFPERIPGINVPMIDVCGAGDTVTAVLAACLILAGDDEVSIQQICKLANFAAAETCKHPGVYVLSQEDLMKYDGEN